MLLLLQHVQRLVDLEHFSVPLAAVYGSLKKRVYREFAEDFKRCIQDLVINLFHLFECKSIVQSSHFEFCDQFKL